MIHGIGIDIVEVDRFRSVMDAWGDRFYRRVFTGEELAYCFDQRYPERHLAARFAAKVAFIKALGAPMKYKDIEIIRGDGGRPSLNVNGLSGELCVSLSIAHDGNLSIAETVLEKKA